MVGKVYPPDDLPNGMIGLNTTAGQDLAKTSIINDLMIERFSNQVNQTYCGPASLALLINALNVAYRIKYMEVQGDKESESEFYNQAETGHFRVTEDDVVNVKSVKEYLSAKTHIATDGLTLQNMEHIADILGFGVNAYFACGNGLCDNEKMKDNVTAVVKDPEYIFKDSDEFKKFAVDYLKRPVTGLIVNYDMSSLGYEDLPGHFSPLAAYDSESDRFLVMDVWHETPPAWVKTDSLFKAMSSVDTDSKLPRGLLHIHELLY